MSASEAADAAADARLGRLEALEAAAPAAPAAASSADASLLCPGSLFEARVPTLHVRAVRTPSAHRALRCPPRTQVAQR